MKRASCVLVILLAIGAVATAQEVVKPPPPPPEPPQAGEAPLSPVPQGSHIASQIYLGEPAPDFELDGSEGRPVRLYAGAVGRWVELHVADHGPGVPEADREGIFEPFRRLGDRPQGDGVGLGLAVARGFVEAMGGQVEFDDTPGGGLTVVVRLRAAP